MGLVGTTTSFSLPHIRLVRLLFLAETVFFSHNNSAGTVFFSQFQPSFVPANGCRVLHEFLLAKDIFNQRQIEPTAFCDLCAVERESIKHILAECTATKGVFMEC